MQNPKYRNFAILFAFLLSQANVANAGLFVTDLIDGTGSLPVGGNQGYTGQLSDDFTVNQSIAITSIGVFDDDGDGTAGDLYWQLFNVSTGDLLHSQMIAASGPIIPTGSSIEDNYLWADPTSDIILAAGEVYSVGAWGFDAIDMNFNTNFDLANLDVIFDASGPITSAGGRFAGAIGSLPTGGNAGNAASTQPYNFGAGTFSYNLVSVSSVSENAVPEPSIIALFGLGLLGLGFARRRAGS